MSRPLSVRKPSANELRRVHQWLEGPLQPGQRRRAEVLLLHAAGRPASAMAQRLQVHVNTVYADRRDGAVAGGGAGGAADEAGAGDRAGGLPRAAERSGQEVARQDMAGPTPGRQIPAAVERLTGRLGP